MRSLIRASCIASAARSLPHVLGIAVRVPSSNRSGSSEGQVSKSASALNAPPRTNVGQSHEAANGRPSALAQDAAHGGKEN